VKIKLILLIKTVSKFSNFLIFHFIATSSIYLSTDSKWYFPFPMQCFRLFLCPLWWGWSYPFSVQSTVNWVKEFEQKYKSDFEKEREWTPSKIQFSLARIKHQLQTIEQNLKTIEELEKIHENPSVYYFLFHDSVHFLKYSNSIVCVLRIHNNMSSEHNLTV
jgi:hypothetical protein